MLSEAYMQWMFGFPYVMFLAEGAGDDVDDVGCVKCQRVLYGG